MPETAADIAKRLAASGANVGVQVRRMIRRMMNDHSLARRVFAGEDGKLTPAAEEWMRRLARDNFVEATTWNGDRDAMLIREGRRKLALEILGSVRLDTERLAALTRLEREVQS